jgi:hypothetical protein
MNGAWLDAAGGGANLLLPVPEPSSGVMTILALGGLIALSRGLGVART